MLPAQAPDRWQRYSEEIATVQKGQREGKSKLRLPQKNRAGGWPALGRWNGREITIRA